MTNRLYPSFRTFASDRKLFKKGDGVVIAVSGGIDSMVLLDLSVRIAKPLQLSVTVAHVNHGLRGVESDDDEAFVRSVADMHGLPFVTKRLVPHPGKNLQDSARQLRASFLREVARESGAQAIALGHHRGDQAETIMMHLLRGAGLPGLRGMKARSASAEGLRLVRPLLFAAREDIQLYAAEGGVQFRNDSSNTQTQYHRNDIRKRLMPLLRELNPRSEELLAAMGERLSEDEDTLTAIAVESFEEALMGRDANRVSIGRPEYDAVPVAIRRRVLREMFAALAGSAADLNSDQLSRMDAIALSEKSGGEYRLKAPWKFQRQGDVLMIERAAPRLRKPQKSASAVNARSCGKRRRR